MAVVAAHMMLKPADLTRASETVYQTYHEARITYSIDNIEDFDQFFGATKDRVRPGDKVTICSFANKGYDMLMEVRELRIISGGQDKPKEKLVAMWTSPKVDVPKPEVLKKQFESQEKKLYCKKEFGGGFTVQDDKENVIERFKTKKEAVDYIERLNRPLNMNEPIVNLSRADMET